MAECSNDTDDSSRVPRFCDAQIDRTLRHPKLSPTLSSPVHTFVVAADTQLGMLAQSRSWETEVRYSTLAVEAINRLKPLYCCVCGDLVESSAAFLSGQKKLHVPGAYWTEEECNALHDSQNAEFRRIWSQLDSDIALVCLCGNHDVGNRPTAASIERFTSSFGDDYLAFWANGTYNVVLNSNLFNNPHLGSAMDLYKEQLAWCQERLEYATRENARQIFLFSHHPWFIYYEEEEHDTMEGYSPYHKAWGEGSIPDGYFHIPKRYREAILDLCRRYDVTAAFAGHFHQNVISETSFGMPMIISGPLSVVLDSNANTSTEPRTQGFRLVTVTHDPKGRSSSRFEHRFIPLSDDDSPS